MVGDIKQILLNQTLVSNGWAPQDIDKVRAAFTSVQNYEPATFARQTGLPRSLLQLCGMLEALLLTKKIAGSIEAGLKQHRCAADIMESEEFTAELQAIAQAARDEQKVINGAAAPAVAEEIATAPIRALDEPVLYDPTSPPMVAAIAACPEASHDELAPYAIKAEKIVGRRVEIVTMPSKGSLKKFIEESPISQLPGTSTLRC